MDFDNEQMELLLRLLRMPSPSFQEERVRKFVISYLKEIGVAYDVDAKGNIFDISRANKPLLCAHMDTVQKPTDAISLKYMKVNGDLIKGTGVLGGDDKCGVFVVLWLLNMMEFNFVLTVEEERGCGGIKPFVKERDFSKVPFGIVLDRRGNSDLICAKNEYGTKEFNDAIMVVAKKYGYKEEVGTISDADYLREKISCANISVGYHDPHIATEYINLNHLQDALYLTMDILEEVKGRFAPPKITAVHCSTTNWVTQKAMYSAGNYIPIKYRRYDTFYI